MADEPTGVSLHPFAANAPGQGDTNPPLVMYRPLDNTDAFQSHTPITTQPNLKSAGGNAGDRMSIPSGIPHTNTGLEYLSMVDQLLVHQKVEILEVLLGCETKNKYKIKNSMGQTIYTAIEDTDCCTRNCLGKMRPLDLKILDNSEREVIHIFRDFRCDSCCCPCCLQRLEVYAPPGNLVGVVKQEWSILRPNLTVELAKEPIFHVDGPLCTISCCRDVDFPVYDFATGKSIGNISKQWSGLGRELFTDADHFGIIFPLELEVEKKALLLGALFLIDLMYFEGQNDGAAAFCCCSA